SYAQHGWSDAHPGARHVRALVPHRLRDRRGEVRRCLHGKRQLDKRRAPSSGAGAMKEKSAMKPRFLIYGVALAAVIAALTAPVVARAADPDWKAVEQALGKSGQMQPGDVFRIGMPRTDLSVTVKGVPVKAGFALGSYAAFKQIGDHAMVMGDLVLLDQEIPAVMSGLFAGGLEVTAVHNHLNEMSPHTMYMHYSGHGDAVQMDKEVNAVAHTLRQQGVDVTAIHNHALMDVPRLFYMHFWANDDPVKLAQALKAALDQTNSRK